jgi:hypothetical protein
MLDPKDQKCSAHNWWAFEGACGKLIAPIAKQILGQTVPLLSYKWNWSSYLFVHNKSRNRLQLKRAEDLVYVYINSRLLAEGKEKDKKKWYADNVDSKDSDSVPEEEVEEHGDLDSHGWNKAILGSEIHMGERTVAPMPQGGTVHEIWKMNTLSKTRKMSTSGIRHL